MVSCNDTYFNGKKLTLAFAICFLNQLYGIEIMIFHVRLMIIIFGILIKYLIVADFPKWKRTEWINDVNHSIKKNICVTLISKLYKQNTSY